MTDIANFPLVSLLKDSALLDDMQAEEIIQESTRTGKRVFDVIVDTGILDQATLLQTMADSLATQVVNFKTLGEIPPEAIAAVPADTAKAYQCVPVDLFGTVLQLALVDPFNPSVVDEIGFAIGKEIVVVVAAPSEIDAAIQQYYGGSSGGGMETANAVSDVLKELGMDSESYDAEHDVSVGGDDLSDMANEAPIVKFVNLVLQQAVQDRASDNHSSPLKMNSNRYRVDGALYEWRLRQAFGFAGYLPLKNYFQSGYFRAAPASGRPYQHDDRWRPLICVFRPADQFGVSGLRVLDRSREVGAR